MENSTLEKANNLNKKIKEFKEALECFESTHPEDETITYSTNPALIIEFDDEDEMRRQLKLPMVLSDSLTGFLKTTIKAQLKMAEDQFKAL